MAYDENLSTKVSLSRILDELISNNEQSNIIVSFLKDHDLDFVEMISDSLLWTKLFQLDFILKCTITDITYIVSKLKSIPARIAAYCAWQVCKTESKTADNIKYLFRQEFSWILTNFNTPHPYGSYIGKEIFRKYDYKLFNAAVNDRIIDEFTSWSDSSFSNFVRNLTYSLFLYRVCEYDVFSQLSEYKKFLLLTCIINNNHVDISNLQTKFIVQILKSNECIAVKQLAVKYFDTCHLAIELSDNDPTNCETFSEMLLKLTIYGIFDYTKTITTLFQFKRHDILYEWLQYDEKLFTEDFCAKDIIIWLHNEKKRFKKVRA